MQVLAVWEKTFFFGTEWWRPHKLSVSERIENLKKDRLAIVEILTASWINIDHTSAG